MTCLSLCIQWTVKHISDWQVIEGPRCGLVAGLRGGVPLSPCPLLLRGSFVSLVSVASGWSLGISLDFPSSWASHFSLSGCLCLILHREDAKHQLRTDCLSCPRGEHFLSEVVGCLRGRFSLHEAPDVDGTSKHETGREDSVIREEGSRRQPGELWVRRPS